MSCSDAQPVASQEFRERDVVGLLEPGGFCFNSTEFLFRRAGRHLGIDRDDRNKTQDCKKNSHVFSLFLFCPAARPRRNGITMRAGFGVTQEGADALIELRRDDVLEAAGLLVRFGVFDGESVGEKAFG